MKREQKLSLPFNVCYWEIKITATNTWKLVATRGVLNEKVSQNGLSLKTEPGKGS